MLCIEILERHYNLENFKFRENNFDLIRLFAAFQVAILHMNGHLGLNFSEKFVNLLGIFPGVPIFFVVSGFLISASWERKPVLKIYAKNRFLRIYPALWFAMFVSVLSVVCFYNFNFTIKNFAVWLVAQSTILQFYNPDFLREYGVGVLNGSLWTIPVELQFYIILPLIYLALKKVYNKKLVIFILVFAAINQLKNFCGGGGVDESLVYKLFGVSIFPYLYMFLVGILIQKNIAFVHSFLVNKFYFWFTAYIIISYAFGHFGFIVTGNKINPINSICLALVVVSFAYTNPKFSQKILNGYDISYDIYIYHMIFVNVLVSMEIMHTIYSMMVCCVLTSLFAIFSWKFIESPCLSLKTFSIKTLSRQTM